MKQLKKPNNNNINTPSVMNKNKKPKFINDVVEKSPSLSKNKFAPIKEH